MNFKKISMIVCIALLSMATVFAASGSGSVDKAGNKDLQGSHATSEVKLVVTEDKLVYYSFGFSSTNSATTPSEMAIINLKFNPTDYTASSAAPAYIYYDVRTASNFDLTLTSDGALKDNPGATKSVNYEVLIDSVKEIDTATSDLEWKASVTDAMTTTNKTYEMKIKTAPIPADGAATYTSTLTLKIAVV